MKEKIDLGYTTNLATGLQALCVYASLVSLGHPVTSPSVSVMSHYVEEEEEEEEGPSWTSLMQQHTRELCTIRTITVIVCDGKVGLVGLE